MYEAMQQPAISPDIVKSLFAVALGFAVAGLCASGYRVFSVRFPSFRLLEVGPMTARVAAVPLLVFAAPFIIMRNTLARAPHGAAAAVNSSWFQPSSPGCGA